jgi:hypothetical protein
MLTSAGYKFNWIHGGEKLSWFGNKIQNTEKQKYSIIKQDGITIRNIPEIEQDIIDVDRDIS